MDQNRVGSGNIGLKGIKGLAQNYQKRDIEFWAALFKVAVKKWSNDLSQCLLESVHDLN